MIQSIKISILSGACCLAAATCVAAGPEAEALRHRLESVVKSGGVMFGQHDATVYGHDWAWQPGRCDVRELCGDYPAILSFDLGRLETGSEVNLDSVPFEMIRNEIKRHHRSGGICTISWHPDNPANGGSTWTPGPGVLDTIVSDREVRRKLESWNDMTADFIVSLRDDQGEPIPVIFRPWHEHTGSWFWWGRDCGSADSYRQLWSMTREAFDKKGVDNVLWSYSPDKVMTAEEYFERYPGDDMVDILGADIYTFDNYGGFPRFNEFANAELAIACDYAAKTGKIAALTETGYEGLTTPGWYDQVLLPAISAFPVAYVCVWRNAHNKPGHYYAPWRGHSDEDSFMQFYNSDQTLFLNDIKQIK